MHQMLAARIPLPTSPAEPLPTSAPLQLDLALDQHGTVLLLTGLYRQTGDTFARQVCRWKATTPARPTKSLTVLLQMAAVAPAML
jgi:hypothetical protein